MTKHVHAEFMAQYAQDALETDKPWERWEARCTGEWYTLSEHPIWSERLSYRRKPTRIQVAGEVFDDVVLSQEEAPDAVYVADNMGNVRGVHRKGTYFSYAQGRVHTTYEGALRHANALVPKEVH